MPRALKPTAQVEIPSTHNGVKVHVFRIYSDGHIAYNQRICGSLFYRSFSRATRSHGYADVLAQVTTCPTKFVRNQHLLLAL